MTDVGLFVRRRSGVTFAVLMVSSLVLMGLNPSTGRLGLLAMVQAGIGSASRWVIDTAAAIGELSRSRAEAQALRAELERVEQRLRRAARLEAENRGLRALLALSQAATESIPAEVIGRDPGNLFQTVTINRGRRHGVRVDDTVVAGAGGFQALVGKIESVSSHTSMVRPIVDSSSYVAARLERTGHDGLIEGDPAGRRLIMRWVDAIAADDVAAGDLVITSGLRSVYPRGFYVGRTAEQRASEDRSSIVLIVQPLVDFGRLDYVVVLRTAERPDG